MLPCSSAFSFPADPRQYASPRLLKRVRSLVHPSAGLAPPTTTFCSSGPSLTNVPQSYSGAGSQQNTVSQTITSLAAPFTLSQEITLTSGRGSDLNVDTSLILTPTIPPIIPEPASIAP